VIIRDLRAGDLTTIWSINQANIPAVGEVTVEQLDRIVTQSPIALGAVNDDDVVTGFCLVLGPGADYGSVNYRWFSERYEHFIYLDRVAVDADHRSQGIGATLYAEVESRAALATDPEPEWFTLEVNLRPRNDGSLRFHHRLGFTEVGQQETPYGSLVSMLAKPLG
jgi:predicted GNAT superfamily acetyltransferase